MLAQVVRCAFTEATNAASLLDRSKPTEAHHAVRGRVRAIVRAVFFYRPLFAGAVEHAYVSVCDDRFGSVVIHLCTVVGGHGAQIAVHP